ncbi:MAG TPA: SDR family oxidoreductase [Steroidobacteraceae bacterium]|nr:SDR family oxidoreductase [Steroidobacteraceae bacterium]
MNRRDAIKLGAATAGVLLTGVAAAAEAKPLRVLIFGGTGFIGPHFVETLRARGHKLTLFNRGKRNPTLFPDVETLIGDRNGQVDAIKGRDWDVVIDDSGYTPKQVKLTTDLLKGHVQHYIFVSSISAYADLTPPGIDEDYRLATLKDPTVEEITDTTYGGLKALCEKTVEQAFGKNSAVVRPSYIVGPGDPTDRFTYWPVRTSKGGEMLAPGSASDPIQFIDVRDLAEFMRGCVEQRFNGSYNACNPPGAVTMGDLLEMSKKLSAANTKFVWAPTEFLEKNKALETGEIPIWAPPVGELAGATLISSARAVEKGMRFRTLETTVRDTLAWHAKRPAEQQQKLRAGFSAEREAQLLKMLKA